MPQLPPHRKNCSRDVVELRVGLAQLEDDFSSCPLALLPSTLNRISLMLAALRALLQIAHLLRTSYQFSLMNVSHADLFYRCADDFHLKFSLRRRFNNNYNDDDILVTANTCKCFKLPDAASYSDCSISY